MRQTLRPSTPFNSFAVAVDPRWKLVAIIIAIATTTLLQTPGAAMFALFGAFALAVVVRVPARWLINRLAIVAIFLAAFTIWLPFSFPERGGSWAIGPLSISVYGLAVAARLWCKALAIVTLVLALAGSTPFSAVLHAAHAIRVPGILVQLISLTHRYALLLSEELSRLRVALRIRGYRNRANMHSYRTIGHVAGILLIRGLERAERVSQAMRCRGFDGRFRSLHAFRSRWTDFAAFLIIVIPAACLLTWDIARR